MSLQLDTGQKASTNNWDTAFAINFKNANKAIVAQKTSPKGYEGKTAGGGFGGTPPMDVKGFFGDWQLNGGSGSIVRLKLPFTNNSTITNTNTSQSMNFNGFAEVEVKLNYLDSEAGGSGASKTHNGGTNKALKTRDTSDHPETDPVATIVSVNLDEAAVKAKIVDDVRDTLKEWLNKNLSSFNHTFSAIDVNATADKGEFQWLMPTKIGYGVSNAVGADVDDYVFGVMAMTEDRKGKNLTYQVSPNIIPDNCNAGFLISQERFMSKIMLPGIKALFKNADTNDFEVDEDGSTITNKNKVTFQTLQTEKKDGSGTINIDDASMDKGKFTLKANATSLTLTMYDIHFPWGEDGGYTVHIDYNADSSLKMDKNKHFQVKTTSKPYMHVTVTESSGEKWKNIIVGIVEGIGLAIAGAALGAALGPAAEAAGEGFEAAGSAAADGVEGTTDALDFGGDFPADDEIDNLDDVNSTEEENASEDVAAGDKEGYVSKFKGFFRRNWRKLLGMAVGGAVGAVLAKLPDILEAYSEKDLAKMPTLDEFVDNSVSTTTWPNQTGYTLESVELNESLQMGLNVSIKD
ncbi:MAG: TULIP family P47-like protein [Bacteroidota bacterium]